MFTGKKDKPLQPYPLPKQFWPPTTPLLFDMTT